MLNIRNIFLILLAFLPPVPVMAASTLPEDKSAVIILAYHRIGEDSTLTSNLRLAQFREHIEEIRNGGYTVKPLPEIIAALKSGTELPPRTLAITFEGGFRSAYKHAIPLLLEHDLPFTIFFASGLTDDQNHISWKELKKLNRKDGVTLGILPASYGHTAHLPPAESRRQINLARSAFKDNIGAEAAYFAYPFGEISTELENIVKAQNFDAAFGLHSGIAHKGSNFAALPRFTMTETHGNIDRFRLVTHALPFPATGIEPENALLTENTHIGFTVPPTLIKQLGALSCFISSQAKPDIQILENRVEIRPKEPLDSQRTRVNCTLPAPKDENDTPRWRWLGMLLHANNQQPDEPQ